MSSQWIMLTAASLFGFAQAMPFAASAQENRDSSTKLEEIIVTANKREQSLLDVASSVTVVSSDVLQSQGLHTMTDWAQLVPGMSFFSRGATGLNQIILRGVTSGQQQISPTVGFYVDETPFGFSIPVGGLSSILQPDLDPFAVERIEVLRGPQGTLYGASTLGGLIKYVVKQPDPEELTGAASFGGSTAYHGGAGYTARGAVNAPLAGNKAALRLSGFSRRDPGYIDNVQNDNDDNNSTDSIGLNATLGLYPGEDVSILISALVQDNEANAFGSIDQDLVTLAPLDGEFEQSRYVDEFVETRYRLFSGTLEWDLGDVTLLSSTSYGYIDYGILFDFSNVLPPDFFGGTFFTGPQWGEYDKLTEELRFTSNNGGAFEWAAGLFYTEENADANSRIELFDAADMPLPTISLAETDGDFRETAVFGNLTFNLTETFDITGGLRWSDNRLDTRILLFGPLSGTDFVTPVVLQGSSDDSVVTWLASANWRFMEASSLYLRAASGYRPGGPVEPPPALPGGVDLPTEFDSDEVVNYEAGTKTELLDGRVQFNAALFFIDWEDIQLPFIVNGFRVLANGGTAESRGIEFDITVRPSDQLTFALNGAYTDSEITEDVPLVGAVAGDRIPYVPEWTIAAVAGYETVLSPNVVGSLMASWHYRSSVMTSFSADANSRELDSYDIVNLRASLTFDDRYSVDLYARNLFDEYGFASGGSFGREFRGVPIHPGVVGISVTARY